MVDFEYDGNEFEVKSGRCYRTVNAVARIVMDEGDFHENYMEFCKGESHDRYNGEFDSCPNLEAVEQYVKRVFYNTPLFSECNDITYAIESFITLAEEMESVRVDAMVAML